jgi:hypothetical protein
MAKAKKPTPKKAKKKGKYDTTLKLNMSFEDAIKMLGTPIKKKSK